MMFLDVTQGVMQMGLAQENQLVEGLPNLAYMPLSVRITKSSELVRQAFSLELFTDHPRVKDCVGKRTLL